MRRTSSTVRCTTSVGGRRLAVALSVAALVLAACGGDGDDDAGPTSTAATASAATEPSLTAPAATEPEVTEPEVTEPEVTEPITTEPLAEPAAIVPSVLCIDARSTTGDVAFAYDNQAESAVVLAPTASTVDGGAEPDQRLVPIVFAPGAVSPAFWVSSDVFGDGSLPTWTVTGPDGESRSATPDASTPACDEVLPASTTSDTREPMITVGNPALGDDGQSVVFTSELVGVPDLSVCPDGLTAGAVDIVTDNGVSPGDQLDLVEFDGPIAEWTTELFPDLDGGPGRFGRQIVAAVVLDNCSAADTPQLIWPGGRFEAVHDGVLVCIDELDGELSISTDEDDPDCRGLPGTGGSRVRPT
jgi:hypothetical protein